MENKEKKFILPPKVRLLYINETRRIIAICYMVHNEIIEYGASIYYSADEIKQNMIPSIKTMIRVTALKRYLNHNVVLVMETNIVDFKKYIRRMIVVEGVRYRNGLPPFVKSIKKTGDNEWVFNKKIQVSGTTMRCAVRNFLLKLYKIL